MKIFASRLSFFATLFTFLLLVTLASLRYTGFFSPAVFINLVDDNAFLGIASLGLTFVILSGGIDLSVGAMIGLASITLSTLIQHHGFQPGPATLLVLTLGAVFGGLMGCLIAFFGLPPFLVTLAGMFLARGLAYTVSLESIQLAHPFFEKISRFRIPIGETMALPPLAIMFVVMVLIAGYVSKYTRFGRNTYAVGGSVQSAVLMGLPVAETQILVYSLNGLFSALAGVVFSVYTSSGSATAGMGLELDAIAAVVIGGTLLKGGSGGIVGTFIGVLILGTIQTIVTFENTVNTWWTKIVIGGLLLLFVILQKMIARERT
ncbi:MAG: sugar ABC transporter permease YjfF [Bdellovibrionales bacterium]|nr:sugar ABC transporter permease YjfF [Oligoflexia bacterium]